MPYCSLSDRQFATLMHAMDLAINDVRRRRELVNKRRIRGKQEAQQVERELGALLVEARLIGTVRNTLNRINNT